MKFGEKISALVALGPYVSIEHSLLGKIVLLPYTKKGEGTASTPSYEHVQLPISLEYDREVIVRMTVFGICV